MCSTQCKPQGYFTTAGSVLFAVLAFLPAGSVLAESTISVATGGAWTHSSDVRYIEPDGTDLTFHEVAWDTKPFDLPPYYGIRFTHWLDRYPNWGAALDFTHAKMIADRDRIVQVSGDRHGNAVSEAALMSETFDELEFSDGHNLITVNLMHRWRLSPSLGKMNFDSTELFVGGGAGVAIPHVEVGTADSLTREFQFAGPAFQFATGATLPLTDRWRLIAEYRLTYADIDAELSGGGRLTTDALTHHLNIGIGFGF